MTVKEKAKRYDELMEALAFWRDFYLKAKKEAARLSKYGHLSYRIHMAAKKEAYEKIINTLERMMGND